MEEDIAYRQYKKRHKNVPEPRSDAPIEEKDELDYGRDKGLKKRKVDAMVNELEER